ncbi:MAG: QcrA and Rieske domain-containing protein [Myxococcales bacterium]
MAPPKLPLLQQPLTRRRLLGLGAAGFGAALALPAAPACGPPPPGPDGGVAGGPDGGSGGNPCPPSDDASACAAGSCQVDGNTLVLAFADHPELVPVLAASQAQYRCDPACPSLNPGAESGQGWGIYCDQRYSDPICNQNAILVLHVSQNQYVALSASCTHFCCTVGVRNDASGLFCPCHGSSYSLTGQVLSSPAPQNLPTLPVCFDACAVYVQLA